MAAKWHLGHETAQSPRARGFESSFALVRAGDNHLGASIFPDEDVPRRENGEPVDLPGGWFGYLALTAPHWPLQLPKDRIEEPASPTIIPMKTGLIARVKRACPP